MRTLAATFLLCLLSAAPLLATPVVLFDEGHGQAFRIGADGPLQLSQLADQFRAAGAEVRAITAPLSATTLDGAAGVVLSGPFAPYQAEELDALLRFVKQGGRVALLLHIAPPVSPLLQRLGVLHSNGVIRETRAVIGGEALNFLVSDLARHPLTAGLERFALYGGWALLPDAGGVLPLAQTGAQAWVDLNRDGKLGEGDAQQAFAVAVSGRLGAGEFVVFGDDALFQNGFLKDDNLILARNLARWLAGS